MEGISSEFEQAGSPRVIPFRTRKQKTSFSKEIDNPY